MGGRGGWQLPLILPLIRIISRNLVPRVLRLFGQRDQKAWGLWVRDWIARVKNNCQSRETRKEHAQEKYFCRAVVAIPPYCIATHSRIQKLKQKRMISPLLIAFLLLSFLCNNTVEKADVVDSTCDGHFNGTNRGNTWPRSAQCWMSPFDLTGCVF